MPGCVFTVFDWLMSSAVHTQAARTCAAAGVMTRKQSLSPELQRG